MKTGEWRIEGGFTYPVVLGMLLVMSVGASVAVPLASTQARRDSEAELLFRGQAYAEAIQAYYHAVPGEREYPSSLDDLVKDPRFTHRRHLRRLYEDPMTQEDWLLIRAPGGGIAGVASRSRVEPLRQGNFPAGLDGFQGAGSYRDWQFTYVPGATN